MKHASFPHRWLFGMMLLHLLLASIYTFRFPLRRQPDEAAHFQYVRHLAEKGKLPVFNPQAEDFTYEAHQPPLFYLTAVPLYWLFQANENAAYYAIRLLSALFGIGTISATFLIARSLSGPPALLLFTVAFAALLPMHLFPVCSSVSNDALAGMLSALSLLLLARTLSPTRPYAHSFFVGIIFGLALLAKSSNLFLLVLALAMICWQGISDKEWKDGLMRAGLVLAGFLITCGWWLFRNVALYGDPLATKQFIEGFATSPKPEYFLGPQAKVQLSLPEYVQVVAITTFVTFFGIFGQVNRAVRQLGAVMSGEGEGGEWLTLWGVFGVLVLAAMLFGAALAGQAVLRQAQDTILNRRHHQREDAPVIALLLGASLLVMLSFILFNIHFFQAQSRYLYPAQPAMAIFFAMGLCRCVPERFHSAALVIFTFAMLLLSATVLTMWMDVN